MDKSISCNSNHILVGIGGTGGKILKAFKMRVFEEFPEEEKRSKLPVALLYIDSTEKDLMSKDGKPKDDFRVMGQDASFTRNEFFNIKAVDVESILDHIDNYPNVKGIVDNVKAVKSAIGSLGEAAGQKRRAGRLLFAANSIGYVNSLRNAYSRCEAISSMDDTKTCIHIFAGLSGGTGSGSIVDAVVQARKTFPNADILVYAMIPEMNLPKPNMDQGRYYQNGYAALNELNGLQAGRWFPQDVTGEGEAHLYNDRVKGVANGLTLYSNVNENGIVINSLEELPKIVSDFIYSRIFLINQDPNTNDILRAFTFENIDDFALELDETAEPDSDGSIRAARTKKINSFGIKRVMYPELRILKHITYTIGESILFQFKYNNWRENQGYVDEECNKDYRTLYLNPDNLVKWKLDNTHLTLEKKVLKTDSDYPTFKDYWHDKAIGYFEEAKKNKNPLNELDSIMGEFYDKHFREEGVESYYMGKSRVIPDISREIRHNVEIELFGKWKNGEISIVELLKVSKVILEKIADIRADLETEIAEKKDALERTDYDRSANVTEWSRLGIFQRMVGAGARRYSEHQEILTDFYVLKTECIALDFARKLVAKLNVEFGKMNEDISAFGQKINDAIEKTKRLIDGQRKKNKGLEDMRGAIIEVCEEERMVEFEFELKTDKIEMPNNARQIRELILPKSEFINFGRLANEIDNDNIKDAFDIRLSEIVKIKHDEKADSEKKVLGLNILTQLQQKLRTDEDIKAFAKQIVDQSGVYLKLNNDQMRLHLRNNENEKSPTNPASINQKILFVSIPSPEDNEGLKRFADKLVRAFNESINQSMARTTITISQKSPCKNELSITTITYCFPMRAIDWLQTYKDRYERFLKTGNAATDLSNAILLHSEKDGSQLPSLFPVFEKKEETPAVKPISTASPVAPPPASPVAPPPVLPSTPPSEPEIKLFIAVNGQQYGPYNNEVCKQLVTNGQLTPSSMVWMEGMPQWTPAGQVSTIQFLFAPPATSSIPPMPPIGSVPPPIM